MTDEERKPAESGVSDGRALVPPEWVPDRACFRDEMGRFYTQSLFLETGYDENALYTLKDADHIYKGKVYPSLRRLYLEMEDPTGYFFSQKYLWGWEHWNRILENKMLAEKIEPWFSEMEVRLRAKGIVAAIRLGVDNLAAAKWLADGKWREPKRGRPSAAERVREKAAREEAAKDASRIVELIPRSKSG